MGHAGNTSVTVFVDDAVLGRLPRVCALTGGPSDGSLTLRTPVGRTRSVPGLVSVVLLFAGPLGWAVLVLLLAWSSGGGEELTVRLPWSAAVQAEVDALRRRSRAAWTGAAVVVAAVVLSVIVPGGGLGLPMPVAIFLLVAPVVAAGIVATWAELRIRRRSVWVELDGSRRWVTLGNVHPAFRAAVLARPEARPDYTPRDR